MKRTNLIATLMMIPGLAVAQEIDGMERPAAALSRQTAAKAKSRAKSYRDLVARPAASLSLGELTNVEKAKVRDTSRNLVALNRVVSREMAAGGSWDFGPDGTRVWRLNVASTGANALRVHFTGFDARDGQVVIYGADNEVVGPYTGKGDEQDGEVWTGLVSGDSMTIEYQTKDESAGIPFENAKVGHFLAGAANTAVRKPFEPIERTPTFQSALGFSEPMACHVDASCVPEQWQPQLRAIAVYFIERQDGSIGACTGTVVTNLKQSFRAYFLTANHCVSTAAEARSVYVIWNYQTSYCNGPEFDWRQLPSGNGARLLVTGKAALGDFTLLLLNQDPPAGARYSGWSANEDALPVGSTSVGLHQPSASYKRVSVGQRQPDQEGQVGTPAGPVTLPEGKYHRVRWQEGLTEGGSSGSGLFSLSGQLVGTLTAGISDCNIVSSSSYGKLSGYFQYLRRYLVDDNI